MAKPNEAQGPGQQGSGVQLSSRCPLCNAEFKANNAEILDESRQGILFHLTCPACQASLLAVVSASKLGLSSFGMVTDLTAADTKRLRKGHTISHEDVLKAYQELTNFKGSFKDIVNHGKHLAQR